MKLIIGFLTLICASMVLGQGIDELGQPPQGGLVKQTTSQEVVKTDLPSLPAGETTIKAEAKAEAKIVNEKHVHPTRVVVQKIYVKPVKGTAGVPAKPKEDKNMPNSVPKNPNVDGIIKFDGNTFPEGNGDLLTVSVGADGSFYAHRDSGGGVDYGLILLILLGGLALLGLIAALLRGGGGGGNTVTIHNAPGGGGGGQNPPPAPQVQGGPAQPAPFAPNPPKPAPGGAGGGQPCAGPGAGGIQPPGWLDHQVILVAASPTGSPSQEPTQPPAPSREGALLPEEAEQWRNVLHPAPKNPTPREGQAAKKKK